MLKTAAVRKINSKNACGRKEKAGSLRKASNHEEGDRITGSQSAPVPTWNPWRSAVAKYQPGQGKAVGGTGWAREANGRFEIRAGLRGFFHDADLQRNDS
jgi:hypothetical protein